MRRRGPREGGTRGPRRHGDGNAESGLDERPGLRQDLRLAQRRVERTSRRYRLPGQQADRGGVPRLDLHNRTGRGQVGRVLQRWPSAVISAHPGVLERIGELQKARLVVDREDERRLLYRGAAASLDRLDQRVNVLLLVTGDQRRERLRLTAEADCLGLVGVEVGLQILEREREVERAHIPASGRAESAAHVGTDGGGAIYGARRHRAAQDEAGAADAVDLNSGQLRAGGVGAIHLSRSYL